MKIQLGILSGGQKTPRPQGVLTGESSGSQPALRCQPQRAGEGQPASTLRLHQAATPKQGSCFNKQNVR